MLSAVLGAAALLLLAAGAAKVVDPTRTVGALRALWGRPVPPAAVRAGAAVETLVGAAALVFRGAAPALAVSVSYLAFAHFVAAALRAGTPVGSCGCFGARDTPPHPAHVGVDLALAVGAAAAAAAGATPLASAGAGPLASAVALAVVAYAALTRVGAARPT